MNRSGRILVQACFGAVFLAHLCAQGNVTPGQSNQSPPPPPPATKLEAFKPSAGSVVTFGYDDLGGVSCVSASICGGHISVDVRELRDAKGPMVRGLVVEVRTEYRKERSFVDADEIPELLKGLDALLEVQANPTQFKNFEVQYTTRGELRLAAYSISKGKIGYAVRAGTTLTRENRSLSAEDMRKLRGMFDLASLKLVALGAAK